MRASPSWRNALSLRNRSRHDALSGGAIRALGSEWKIDGGRADCAERVVR
jgi:hypothetical protein